MPQAQAKSAWLLQSLGALVVRLEEEALQAEQMAPSLTAAEQAVVAVHTSQALLGWMGQTVAHSAAVVGAVLGQITEPPEAGQAVMAETAP